MRKLRKTLLSTALAAALSTCMIFGCTGPEVHAETPVAEGIASETDAQGFTYVHDPMENPKAAADILPDENAIYGYVPSPDGSLAIYASYDFSDPDVVEAMREERVAYHEEMNQLFDIIISMKAEGSGVEEIARAVSKRRNEIRLEAYKDDPEGLAKVKERNLQKYGDENGPTADSLYEKYGSWETVAEKSFSPNAGADAVLGLYDLYYDQDTDYIHELVISPASIAKATVKASASQPYTGSAVTPAVTVTIGDKLLVDGTDYTVTYKNNINVGTATIRVKGKGDYTGTLTKTFKIKPKRTSLKKVTAGTKSLTVTWTQQKLTMKNTHITGYQLQYSTDASFAKGNKLVTVPKYSSSSRTIKNLSKGKTYYVRIRTYKTIGGVNIYSTWSAAKNVKVK